VIRWCQSELQNHAKKRGGGIVGSIARKFEAQNLTNTAGLTALYLAWDAPKITTGTTLLVDRGWTAAGTDDHQLRFGVRGNQGGA
jgi:hypothetical protein